MLHSFLRHFDRINDKYGAWLFYIGLFLMIVCYYWFSTSEEMPKDYFILRKAIFNISKSLLILRTLLFVRRYPRYVLLCIAIYPILKLSAYLCGWNVLTTSFIIIAASKDTDIKQSLRIYVIAFVLVLLAAPISWSIGWTEEVIKHKFGLIGHSLGFSNPNTLAALMQMLALLALCFWNVHKTSVIWITCWATALFVGLLTLSMTSVVILLLAPVLYYFIKKQPVPAWSLTLLPWLFLLASIILSCYYGPSYGETTFESRFSISALVYQNHGLSLFGQEYGFTSFAKALKTGTHPLCIDNAYMHLVLCDGIVVALLVLVFFSHLFFKIGKNGQPLLITYAILIALSGMMEYAMLKTIINFLLLYYFHSSPPPSTPVQEGLDP